MSEPKTDGLKDEIIERLREVLHDPTSPAASRVQAARTLAEMKGMIGANGDALGDVNTAGAELTGDELDAQIMQLQKDLRK